MCPEFRAVGTTEAEDEAAGPVKVRSAVESQAGLASYYGKLRTEAAVAGVSGSVRLSLYEGDARRQLRAALRALDHR